MAVENLISTRVDNFNKGITDDGSVYGVGGFYRDVITTTETSTSINSTYRTHVLASNVIPRLIGVRGNGTTVISAYTLQLFSTATQTAYTVIASQALTAVTSDNRPYNIGSNGVYQSTNPRTLWEIAGLATDPGGNFHVQILFTANSSAAGAIEVYVESLRVA